MNAIFYDMRQIDHTGTGITAKLFTGIIMSPIATSRERAPWNFEHEPPQVVIDDNSEKLVCD
jgi:hypothetical protein